MMVIIINTTGPDCEVVCNLINTRIHTRKRRRESVGSVGGADHMLPKAIY